MNTAQKYLDCVAWLFAKFPAYQQVGASAYKPGLERVHLLLERLHINHKKIPSIHIAGTNGKGGTAAYCASILTEKKFKVGLFTSPHVFDFSERISVNGQVISKDFVIQFCERIQLAFPELDASFFELTFAMALAYFEVQNCDYMVIETGLGGRLDATNVIEPSLSIITNISLDHQEFLGNTLSEIAAEKAGIIKPRTPVILGEKNASTFQVFEQRAKYLQAPIFCTEAYSIDELWLNKVEGYAQQNLKNAIVGLSVLGVSLNQMLIETAIKYLKKNTGYFGRYEIIQESPKVIIDVSHNTAGISATLSMIEKELKGRLFIIYGAAQDKNAAEIIERFPKNATVMACTFQNKRSKSKQQWQDLGIQVIFDDINEAKERMLSQMNSMDLLWITGSFFLIADLEQE